MIFTVPSDRISAGTLRSVNQPCDFLSEYVIDNQFDVNNLRKIIPYFGARPETLIVITRIGIILLLQSKSLLRNMADVLFITNTLSNCIRVQE